MNLHDLDPDITLEFLQQRYPNYQFDRLGPESIHFRYHAESEWRVMSISNYEDYARAAATWQAERFA